MKALSVTQPWATLIALGAQRIETRSWDPHYKGPLAIHAAKGFPGEYQELCLKEPFSSAITPTREHPRFADARYVSRGPARGIRLPLGCIVAVCELVDVVSTDDDFVAFCLMNHLYLDYEAMKTIEGQRRYQQELAFGDYSSGRYMWLLSNVRALPKPIPARGRLGLWEAEIDEEAIKNGG